MMATANLKRINSVEVQLAPKDWAIRLADEIAKHDSWLDYSKALAKHHSIEDTLFGKPFPMLHEQAGQKYPGARPEDIRAKAHLSRQLRLEYHTLKLLLTGCNDEIAAYTEKLYLRINLHLADLKLLIILDAAIPLAGGIKNNIPILKDRWIQDSEKIIAELICHESAILQIQDKYFDGHTILFKENKAFLAVLRKAFECQVCKLNEHINSAHHEYLKAAEPIDLKKNEELYRCCLADAFAKKWVEFARYSAKADILKETDEADKFLWEWQKEEVRQHGKDIVYEVIEKEGAFTCSKKER